MSIRIRGCHRWIGSRNGLLARSPLQRREDHFVTAINLATQQETKDQTDGQQSAESSGQRHYTT